MTKKIRTQDRRVLYTKIFLKNSLLKLLKEKPISKITVTELCRYAGINRNTFYAHFSKPEEVLLEIKNELYEEIKHSLENKLETENLLLLLTKICEELQAHQSLYYVMFPEYGDRSFITDLFYLIHDRCLDLLRLEGIQDDSLLEYLYIFYTNGTISLLQQWMKEGMPQSPSSFAALISCVSYEGLKGFIK